MGKSDRANRKINYGWKGLCITIHKKSSTMVAVILAVLQITLLVLRAYFTRNDENSKSFEHLKAAQAQLDAVAREFLIQVRYTKHKPTLIDQVQDALDEDQKLDN